MNYDYPVEIEGQKMGWQIIYPSARALDRGMTIETLMRRRPLALYETKTQVWTDLRNGSRHVLGMKTVEIPEWLRESVDGQEQVLVPDGVDMNTQHTVSTRTLEEALGFIGRYHRAVVEPRLLESAGYQTSPN